MWRLFLIVLLLGNTFIFAENVPTVHSVPQTTKPYYFSNGELGVYRNFRDFIGFDIKASSTFNKLNDVDKLNDNNYFTAWISKNNNAGINENIEFIFKEIHFTKVLENKKKRVTLEGLRIISGFNKDEKLWNEYARPMAIKLYHNKKLICIIKLFDTPNWQEVKLPEKITIKPGDKIKIKIIDNYPQELDRVKKKLAITEIQLLGSM